MELGGLLGKGAKANGDRGKNLHEKTGCMVFVGGGGGGGEIHGFLGDLGIYMGKSRRICDDDECMPDT